MCALEGLNAVRRPSATAPVHVPAALSPGVDAEVARTSGWPAPAPRCSAPSTVACRSRRPAPHRTTWRRWPGWRDRGGGLLGVRIRVGLDRVTSRGRVDWQALTGPVDFLVTELARYADLGVADLSLIPGQDDDSSRATVEALVECRAGAAQ